MGAAAAWLLRAARFGVSAWIGAVILHGYSVVALGIAVAASLALLWWTVDERHEVHRA